MTQLTYKDSDNCIREVKGCRASTDKQGRYWVWSDTLKHNLAYKSESFENALLASIARLLFTIELKEARLAELQRIADLAGAFADQIKPDDQDIYY